MLPARCAALRPPQARCMLSRPSVARACRAMSTAKISRHGLPFRLAVIGSGPAGFYTAYRAMTRIQNAKVDMYEALPVPYGLVRFGVAPDHPEVKNCQEKFEEVASSPNFTFIGNVSVGTKSDHPDGAAVPLASILRHYNAVVFSYGAAKDRLLGVPGESTLKGVYSARQFVGWYNGLPEHADLAPDLTQGDEAVVIGQGNVALDVARMLLEDVDVLRKSDIAEHALDTLAQSRVKRVHIVGRRGPMQAAFTIKEVRELMRLRDVAFHPVDRALIPADISALPRAPRRLMDILLRGSPSSPQQQVHQHEQQQSQAQNQQKSWSLDFLLSPTAFLPSPTDPSRLASTEFQPTSLSDPFNPHAAVRTAPDQPPLTLPSALAFRSIGYKSEPLPEFSQLGIPFDVRRGVLGTLGPNAALGVGGGSGSGGGGRVLRVQKDGGAAGGDGDGVEAAAAFPGLYCAGWVKRGPTGVIASTMEDAFATADAMAEDWAGGRVKFLNEHETEVGGGVNEADGWEGVKREEGVVDVRKVVDWEGWRRIDAAERERGKEQGRERVKFTRTAEMLKVALG